MMEPGRAGGRQMGEAKIDPMDADTFLDWCTRQEESYELVDGAPRMLVGARRAHDNAVVNGIAALRQRLRGGPCRPLTEGQSIRIPNGNVRRPDIMVDCGRNDPDLLHAERPVLVIEILSPSTREIDRHRKLSEYQTVPSIEHILLVEPGEAAAILFTRASPTSWSSLALVGPHTDIPLTALGLTLKLSEFYD